MPCGFNSAFSERGSPFHSLGFPKFMSFSSKFISTFKAHRATTPVVIGSSRFVLEDCRFLRVSGWSCFSLPAFGCGFLSRSQPHRVSGVLCAAQAFSQHPRQLLFVRASRFLLQKYTEKPVASSFQKPNNSFNRTAKKRPFSLRPPRVAAG